MRAVLTHVSVCSLAFPNAFPYVVVLGCATSGCGPPKQPSFISTVNQEPQKLEKRKMTLKGPISFSLETPMRKKEILLCIWDQRYLSWLLSIRLTWFSCSPLRGWCFQVCLLSIASISEGNPSNPSPLDSFPPLLTRQKHGLSLLPLGLCHLKTLPLAGAPPLVHALGNTFVVTDWDS